MAQRILSLQKLLGQFPTPVLKVVPDPRNDGPGYEDVHHNSCQDTDQENLLPPEPDLHVDILHHGDHRHGLICRNLLYLVVVGKVGLVVRVRAVLRVEVVPGIVGVLGAALHDGQGGHRVPLQVVARGSQQRHLAAPGRQTWSRTSIETKF